MENSSIQNRMKKLEHKHPLNAKEDTGIPISEDARVLLEPWYNALLESGKKFNFYCRAFTLENVFAKCLADQVAMTTEEGFCGGDEGPNGVIGINVAERVITQLKGYGIDII